MSSAAENITYIEFTPDTNCNLLQYSILRIQVKVHERTPYLAGPYKVYIRTNLNQGHSIRRQIIDRVEQGLNYSTDFYDIPARFCGETGLYEVDILLRDVGYFEFKVRVESVDKHQPWVKWAEGANIGISVTPLAYGRDNSIYCAFIRQFGRDKSRKTLRSESLEQAIADLEKQGAYVIPPGGNFDSFAEALPFIIEELGMKIIHLLPINPVPTSYARMGMYGSPYATTDYFGIDHTYGTFSRYKTIEDQFIDLTATIHGLGAKVFLDMVVNHTGWASSLLFTHRNWVKLDQDRRIISPGAWGVIWGDLVELDFSHRDLWQYMAGVFLAWCQRGIDGFRLDAGYKVPLEVWQYIISKVREKFPNTLFLLEGLGGPWETTETLLTRGQINWAYSELFQNYTRSQITNYLDYAQKVSREKGIMVHYAETHDNDRLAKKGRTYTLMRLQLCAFTSFAGAWGFTNGVEWLATEKIDVHRNSGLNWGSNINLVQEISRINRILVENPAFWEDGNLEYIPVRDENQFAFLRKNKDNSNIVCCLINLNTERETTFRLEPATCTLGSLVKSEMVLHDLLSDQKVTVTNTDCREITLGPGQCVLYRLEKASQPSPPNIPALFEVEYDRIAMIYSILLQRFAPHEVGRINQEKLLHEVKDLRKFIALVNTVSLDFLIKCNLTNALAKITPELIERYSSVWSFKERTKEFIISGDQWLIVETFVPCTTYLETADSTLQCESISNSDGIGQITCFPPQGENQQAHLKFYWKIRRNRKILRYWQDDTYPILSVPSGRRATHIRKIYPIHLDKSSLHDKYATVLLTNGIGGLCQCPARPGIINTKYDAVFALTPDSSQADQRLALVKMLKETVQIGRKYFDLDESFLRSFTRYPFPVWEFYYNDGRYRLTIERTLVMPQEENRLFIRYKLKDTNTKVHLISKCYVECRSIHEQMLVGADDGFQRWLEGTCRTLDDYSGIRFTPRQDISVDITAWKGEFIAQPHWIYNLEFPQDIERGLPGRGDAFGPGMFTFDLEKGNSGLISISAATDKLAPSRVSIHSAITRQNKRIRSLQQNLADRQLAKDSFIKMLTFALDQFIIRSDGRWHLIAGYPWLPVQVRDMLHSIGGLLAIGRYDVVRDLLCQAAESESHGLLADRLDGRPPTRTCTESSLRLFFAARDYAAATGSAEIWHTPLPHGRTFRQVLESIYTSLRDGYEFGPVLDQATGMLFNPECFSWMNTTYPIATPRNGFPVEIQAFWFQVLTIVSEVLPDYAAEAEQIKQNLSENFLPLFWNEKRKYLADLLPAERRTGARYAPQDTALRFNQLYAIQAGLVPADKTRKIVEIIDRMLVVPVGVRTLAQEPLEIPLRITDHRGILLADPRMPYQGVCIGDETTRRAAYHNGTAWPMAYPLFIESRAAAFENSPLAVKQALAYFAPLNKHLAEGGIGTISEMQDANYPHNPRGCYAYCPAVAEALRVYMKLKYAHYHSHGPKTALSGAMSLKQ